MLLILLLFLLMTAIVIICKRLKVADKFINTIYITGIIIAFSSSVLIYNFMPTIVKSEIQQDLYPMAENTYVGNSLYKDKSIFTYLITNSEDVLVLRGTPINQATLHPNASGTPRISYKTYEYKGGKWLNIIMFPFHPADMTHIYIPAGSVVYDLRSIELD